MQKDITAILELDITEDEILLVEKELKQMVNKLHQICGKLNYEFVALQVNRIVFMNPN